MKKRALITGITGQDGSYLAELLLSKGYEVHGLVRKVAIEDPVRRLWRVAHILDKINLHAACLDNYASVFRAVLEARPDECYHLAAQTDVGHSFSDEFSTLATNIDGTHYVLAAVKDAFPNCHFYFAGSSEMFGHTDESPQNERTAFHPRSPYGISKVAGYYITQNYREAYGMFAVSGILFNHESERRGMEFVTRKITSTVAKIKMGTVRELRLGNLHAQRDWGYAPDYVTAMWSMMQCDTPNDYVVATGVSHSVREFLDAAFQVVSLDWKDYVIVDGKFFRPAEVNVLRGDASRAAEDLGWRPTMKFERIVETMVEFDLAREMGNA